jgi:hypothetical protein
MNSTVKKKVNFINSAQYEGLSPSCIALSFDGFGSISWHSIWVLSALSQFFFGFPTFRPEHHWRDLISWNVHLVHQTWYRISHYNFSRLSWHKGKWTTLRHIITLYGLPHSSEFSIYTKIDLAVVEYWELVNDSFIVLWGTR